MGGGASEKYSYAGFNPRPPRGRRHSDPQAVIYAKEVSIHAPREGGDQIIKFLFGGKPFQSTPPAREATLSP